MRPLRSLGITGWSLLATCLACNSSAEPANVPAAISIIPGPALSLNVGGQVSLIVRVKNSAGEFIQSPGIVSFVSRDSSVVAVDGEGKATALHPGVTYVVASLATGTRVLLDSTKVYVVTFVGSTMMLAKARS
jgi:hypothetical protein